MAFRLFVEFNHALLLACLTVQCLLGTAVFGIVILHLRFRRQGLEEEARLLDLPLPLPDALPDILVQLPTYNEGELIRRVVSAVQHLTWPRDRLHVQILDDSTDGSTAHGEVAAAALRQAGIDAQVLHRSNRTGFKAGALAEGLRRSHDPFVAILDADYLPRPDFLIACMRPLLEDPNLALVQARCDYLNADENLVTYAQQRILDAHFAVEQAARSWSGQVMPFNGTCGIWRRAAIDAAGGWQGDTLAEDLDLSYRVQMLGWRTMFLSTVTVGGELPNSFKTWRLQQFRWTKGFAEVGRKLLRQVWLSKLRPDQKLVSTVHLSSGFLGPLLGITLASAAFDFIVGEGPTWPAALLFGLAALEGTVLGPAALILTGQLLTRGARLHSELPKLPLVMGLQLYMGLANLGGAVEALLGHDTAFERTPKGSADAAGVAPER
jgi:cellulose synthase/poly-beta-1,6-N-acetylglucosamine synthase-like glycosyltransferase